MAAGVAMVEAGADWVDVGGESTRPGAVEVPEAEERSRVIPVIGALAAKLAGRARISVDTYKAGTAAAALAAGAGVVNDVSGGVLDPDILAVTAQAGAAFVAGHLRGRPATMMNDVRFDDPVDEVGQELEARVGAARAAGCAEVWADPGIGFGKRLRENLAILGALPVLRGRLGVPVMVGVSHKRFLGDLTGRPANERGYATAAAVTACVLAGVEAVRVHDVAAMRDVVIVAAAIATSRDP